MKDFFIISFANCQNQGHGTLSNMTRIIITLYDFEVEVEVTKEKASNNPK